jgi:hypothetical protein
MDAVAVEAVLTAKQTQLQVAITNCKLAAAVAGMMAWAVAAHQAAAAAVVIAALAGRREWPPAEAVAPLLLRLLL